MSGDLSLKCRTCLSDSNVCHQLFDYVDENYKIMEMIDGIVPQIDIKNNNSQFSTKMCQCCLDKLVTGFKFQQLCIETNNRLHDFLGIADVYETEEPRLVKILDPLMGDSSFKMKQEMEDAPCFECEINLEELEVAIKSEDNEKDCRPAKCSTDTDSSNEKLSVLKKRSTKNPSLEVTNSRKANKNNRCKVQFPCLECGKVFDRLYNLKRHSTVHSKERSFSCDICNNSFTAKKAFKAHMLTHDNGNLSNKEDNDIFENNGINECKEINENIECNQSKPKRDDKGKEENNELKVVLPFQCPDCPKAFEKKISLSAHYKSHRKKESNKSNNGKKTKSVLEFDGVIDNSKKEATVGRQMEKLLPKVSVKEEIEVGPQIFEESMDELGTNAECLNNEYVDSDDKSDKGLLAKSASKLTKDTVLIDTKLGEIEKPNSTDKKSGNFPCDVCGKVFDRSFRLKRHCLKRHSLNKHHECEICKYRFTTVNILKAHMIQHDNDGVGNLSSQQRPEYFKCPDCPRRFEKQASLSAHRQIHRRNASKANYPCTVCQCNFISVRSLTEHITNKHPEVEKHKCDQCDKSFVLHTHLVEHLNRHKGKKNRVCLICEKEFAYSHSLKDHMRTHSGENPYLCPQCGKTFRSAGMLCQHMERHTGSKNYQCPECPSRFKCKSDLIKHTSTHTNAKPHVCDICGSRFKASTSLHKHKMLHSGKRPFKCDQCGMTFAVFYNLRRHMRTHTGEKPYKCKYCERAYAESGDLTKHLRTHVGENTYMCDQCPKAFKYQAELKQHQSEHYKMAQQLLLQAQNMSEEPQ